MGLPWAILEFAGKKQDPATVLCDRGANICIIEIFTPGKGAVTPGDCNTGSEEASGDIHRELLTARFSLNDGDERAEHDPLCIHRDNRIG